MAGNESENMKQNPRQQTTPKDSPNPPKKTPNSPQSTNNNNNKTNNSVKKNNSQKRTAYVPKVNSSPNSVPKTHTITPPQLLFRNAASSPSLVQQNIKKEELLQQNKPKEENLNQKNEENKLTELPIDILKKEITDHVYSHHLTVIRADTGVGKSSRVPQFLYHTRPYYWKQKYIVITQPRRAAAISLCKRVAMEVGDLDDDDQNKKENKLNQNSNRKKKIVGYAIGNNPNYDENTEILYVTTGWLLYKLLSSPEFFQKCSCIILDEVHERSLVSDMLYLVIKELFIEFDNQNMDKNKFNFNHPPKLVIMSATMEVDLFAEYFQPENPPEPIIVRNSPYPVEIIFLNDLSKHSLTINLKHIGSNSAELNNLILSNNNFDSLKEIVITICQLIAYKHKDQVEGTSVLIFCAGIADIELIMNDILLSNFATEVSLFILHSSIDQEEQMSIFNPLSPKEIRLVLSTNIAESSLTVPNLRYVIDFGLKKHLKYNIKLQCDVLDTDFISQASAKQRAGRVGRVCEGTVFRLYKKEKFQSFDKYDVPEILRVSLHSLVLLIKSDYSKIAGNNLFSNPKDVLQKAIQPPDIDSIYEAYQLLFKANALKLPDDIMEEIINSGGPVVLNDSIMNRSLVTSLGYLIAKFPLDIQHSKLLSYSLLFDTSILPYVVIIAASFSTTSIFKFPSTLYLPHNEYCQMMKSVFDDREKFGDPSLSDSICLIKVYSEYLQFKRRAKEERNHHAYFPYSGISKQRLEGLENVVKDIVQKVLELFPDLITDLLPLLGNSKKFLQRFRGKSNVDFNEKNDDNNPLPIDDKIIDRIKLLIGISFPENILFGSVDVNRVEKYTSKLKKFLSSENNAEQKFNIKNTLILGGVPPALRESEELKNLFLP